MEKIYLFYMVMGFCLGSILFAYEIPRMVKHVDIRQISEDGNPGTFNAFAAAGVGWGILVLLAELLKGFFPVYLCSKRAGQDSLLFAGVLAAPVFGHAAVHIINWGFPGNAAYAHSKLICNSKKSGRFLDDLDVSVPYNSGYTLSCKSKIIQHIGFISPPGHSLCNGTACRVVSASGVAG